MREYRMNQSSAGREKQQLPWLSIFLGAGVALACVLAFAYLNNNLSKRERPAAAAPGLTTLPPPPAAVNYEFYDILNQEEPIRIAKEEQAPTGSRNLYYVIVKGYRSYDAIRAAAKQMQEWGVQGKIGAEPYAAGTEILFQIKVGPFESRSVMNAQRDLLYDKDLANEGLTLRR